MIESKELITGEVQGTSEPKFVVLTEEEITKMMKRLPERVRKSVSLLMRANRLSLWQSVPKR